ncbi:hypothetical protein PANDA_008601, partial [Ailuropoda melanoleuca]
TEALTAPQMQGLLAKHLPFQTVEHSCTPVGCSFLLSLLWLNQKKRHADFYRNHNSMVDFEMKKASI